MADMTQRLNQQLKYYNRIVAVAVAFIAVGTVFYHFVEKFGWLDSLYFTVVTLATVGYGDLTPKTAAGKLFTIVYIFVGITIFIALAHTVLAKALSKRIERKKQN